MDHTTIWRWVQRYGGSVGTVEVDSPYLNSLVEQGGRALTRGIDAKQRGPDPSRGPSGTIQGCEVIHMIRKGRLRWLLRGM